MSFVIANWKMKLGVAESQALASVLKRVRTDGRDVVVCPSFPSLGEISKMLKGSVIKLGAQDCFWEADGAFTGEVSAKQLKEVGCEYVLIGHSERRQFLNETDEMVHKKIRMALLQGLTPIVCVGETFDQRQSGAKDYVLIQQTTKAFEGVDVNPNQHVIIAYEPVWVIGSGQAIDPNEAGAAHLIIRQTLFDLFPSSLVKSNFHIIYGGSVDGDNVSNFTSLEHTDGVLVGGASLNIETFAAIIKNA
jgi:triosephosphate isomerase